jgi:hypothetical protein
MSDTGRSTNRARQIVFVGVLIFTLATRIDAAFGQTSTDGNHTDWKSVGIALGVLIGLGIAGTLLAKYNAAVDEAKRDRAEEVSAQRQFFEQPPGLRRKDQNAASAFERPETPFEVPALLEIESRTLIASAPANIYSSPKAKSGIVGTVSSGERIHVFGFVGASRWALVGRQERALGYLRLGPSSGKLLEN